VFSFISPQQIHFGRGVRERAVPLAQDFGRNVVLVYGATPARAQWLVQALDGAGINLREIACAREPALPDIEAALDALDGFKPDVVIGLGGGSVIDFAKALSALIPCNGAPLEYLEGVGGGRPLPQAALPMIALPTTAGTGAEVTKNAVIMVPEHGVKVSLRHDSMVPIAALVDPDLMQGAPRRVVLASGLDAITQVIEPYLSVKSNPMSDAISAPAIPRGLAALRDLVEHGSAEAWDDMAWVSTSGGLALANSGLGAVHGFAGVLGGHTGAPHGEICGALLPAVLRAHAVHAVAGTPTHKRLNWIMERIDYSFGEGKAGAGLPALEAWAKAQGLRGLAEMGLDPSDRAHIAAQSAGTSSMKGNPFVLSQAALVTVLDAAN
jgi:alcohol dehydrogenase class IV